MGMSAMARILVLLGCCLVLAGLLWPWLGRFPLGRLPGDIVIRRDGFTLYLPITSCILVSLLLSLVVRIFRNVLK